MGDDDWHLPKDNSNQNQAMLLQDFKRRLSQPLGSDKVAFLILVISKYRKEIIDEKININSINRIVSNAFANRL